MLIRPLAEEFLTHLHVERRFRPNSIRAYDRDLHTFLRFLEERSHPPTVESVTPELLREYMSWLSGRELGAATLRRRFHGLRSFWAYLCDWHEVARNPFRRISLPRPPHRSPVFLTREEVGALLAATESTRFVVRGIRDHAVLTLLVCTGLRRQEVLDLQLPDVDLREAVLRVRNGKGGRARIVPLLPDAIAALRDWLELRPCCDHRFLFTNHMRAPLGIKGIHDLFRRALRRSGIEKPGVTLHTLRHTFATLMLRGGCDLRSLQSLLGHASLETTAIYLHSDLKSLRRAVDTLSLRLEEDNR